MKGLYHYQGMPLHYLSEDQTFAVYQAKYNPDDKPQIKYNPFIVYRLSRRYSVNGGWCIQHHKVDRYADLYSAIQRVRREQGYSC